MCKAPAEIYETSISYLRGDDHIIVSTTDYVWANKIVKLQASDPENVVIKTKNPDGSVVAKLPKEYLSLRKPIKRELTEEQRIAARERMTKARLQKDGTQHTRQIDQDDADTP